MAHSGRTQALMTSCTICRDVTPFHHKSNWILYSGCDVCRLDSKKRCGGFFLSVLNVPCRISQTIKSKHDDIRQTRNLKNTAETSNHHNASQCIATQPFSKLLTVSSWWYLTRLKSCVDKRTITHTLEICGNDFRAPIPSHSHHFVPILIPHIEQS